MSQSATDQFRERSRIDHCRQCEGRRQNIMGHLGTFRERSRITMRQGALSLKGGNLFVEPLSVTEEVAPGNVVDVGFTVNNGADFINNLTEPDICETGGLSGYDYEVIIDPTWTETVTKANCIPVGDIFSNPSQDFSASLRAPEEPGNFRLRITLRGAKSGASTSLTRFVTVTSPGDGTTPEPSPEPEPEPSPDCPSGVVFDPRVGLCVPEGTPGAGDGDEDDQFQIPGLPEVGPVAGAAGALFVIVLISVLAG